MEINASGFYIEIASLGVGAVPANLTPSVVAELHGSALGAGTQRSDTWQNAARIDVALAPKPVARP